MTRFNNLAASSGGMTQNEKDQVNGAYSRYRAAYKQALQAAGNNPDAPAFANVSALATQVIGAIDESVP
jgi:phage tail sheath protein FI